MPEEKNEKQEKQPAGGLDTTKVPPRAGPGYTVKFTFHRAENLPMSDYGTLSSDPYILATLYTDIPKRHKEDNDVVYRTPTIHKNEDPANQDDKLGHVHINYGHLDQDTPAVKEQAFKIEKRTASLRAYTIRYCAVGLKKKRMHGRVIMSIEVIGKTETQSGKVFTVGPNYWSQHFSPLIGRLTNTKGGEEHNGVEKFDFEANQIQLAGPVPDELYHRYVEFKGFVKGMFTATGFRGKPLHYLLRKQHNNIYMYNGSTKYGTIEAPGESLTQQFLKMVHYSQGFRIYTYVILLDGLMRFTETGKEFGIDLLSKHTMHSNVSQYIACSGEFHVRKSRNRRPRSESQTVSAPTSGRDGNLPGPVVTGNGSNKPKSSRGSAEQPSTDPSDYELIIDNDSGTYRPDKSILPQLQKFLESNFKGLKISVMDCGDDKLQEMKEKRRENKRNQDDRRVYRQNSFSSSGSISSSDEEELNNAANAENREKSKSGRVKRAKAAVSSPQTAIYRMAEKAV